MGKRDERSIGAIDTQTGKYVIKAPNNIRTSELCEYICIACLKPLIANNGAFKHHELSTCTNTLINESPEHWGAKHILKHMINTNQQFTIVSPCQMPGHAHPLVIENATNCRIEVERRLNNKLRRHDVTFIMNNAPFIIEVFWTHKTTVEYSRAQHIQPHKRVTWLEIHAQDVIQMFNYNNPQHMRLLTLISNCGCDTYCGNIYYKQRGAGCGKTYESIQYITDDKLFADKTTYFYLTKTHSAKDVILGELNAQLDSGKLVNTDFIDGDDTHKQYRFELSTNNVKKRIIIGTIDSFICAIHRANKGFYKNIGLDYFEGLVDDLCDIEDINIRLRYANYINYLDNSLIIIDEAQDLSRKYLFTFDKIFVKTKMDFCVIGDKLQSIMVENNLLTCLGYFSRERLSLRHRILNEESGGINVVRRFHNKHFMGLVNSLVNFKKFGLNEITGICEGYNCGHVHSDEIPYIFFPIENNAKTRELTVKAIIKYVDDEVSQAIKSNGTLKRFPENFMFIFPIIKNNILADQLNSGLNAYWAQKFKESSYRGILDDYWLEPSNHTSKNEYSEVHFSTEGKPINLRTSERKSKILSIHASKGSGCEVVFFLDCSESHLRRFKTKPGDLVFESLLHVGLTRQKEKLYIGYKNINDNITARYLPFLDINLDDTPFKPSKVNSVKRVCDFITNEMSDFIGNDYFDKCRVFNDASSDDTDADMDMAIIDCDNASDVEYVDCVDCVDCVECVEYVEYDDSDYEECINQMHQNITNQDEVLISTDTTDTTNTTNTTSHMSRIIDWIHHCIRFNTMKFRLQCNFGWTSDHNIAQTIAILRKFSSEEIIVNDCNYTKFYDIINNNRSNNLNDQRKIPILSNGTDRWKICSIILEGIIRNVIDKIINFRNKHNRPNWYRFKKFKELSEASEQTMQSILNFCPMEAIVYMYMLEIWDGIYGDGEITISKLYDIIMARLITKSKCMNKFCCCDELFVNYAFNDTSNKNFNETLSDCYWSIDCHYKFLSYVDDIYDIYDRISRTHIFVNEKVKYLTNYSFSMDINGFKVKYLTPFIGISDSSIVLFIITPKICEINKNETYVNAVLGNFIASNSSSNCLTEAHKKKIYTCILPLESDDGPCIYDLKIKPDDPNIKNIISNYLYLTYSNYHHYYGRLMIEKHKQGCRDEELFPNAHKYLNDVYNDFKHLVTADTCLITPDTEQSHINEIKNKLDAKLRELVNF